ncbi:extracellular solute-binding protein [Bradyrhizobium sp. CCGE-LA001]|uniref:extracellular solute-binding protein n=1 Tax=Bradyrhizobium sp. CCGE-LA001 TaxID=1223566 RepID=UPI003FA4657E
MPIKDVYKVLSTPESVERAFKKLDTIKKEVVWWQSGAQAPQLLADGWVVMTSAWNGGFLMRTRTPANTSRSYGISRTGDECLGYA